MKATATAEAIGPTPDHAIQTLQEKLVNDWWGWETVSDIRITFNPTVFRDNPYWAAITVEKEIRD